MLLCFVSKIVMQKTRMEKPMSSNTAIRLAVVLYIVMLAQIVLPIEYSVPLIVLVGFSVVMLTADWQEQGFYKIGLPLLVVSVIGLHGIFVHETRHILRDIAYALSPIALSYIGYWMAGNAKMWPSVMKIVMVCGFVFAARHLMVFVETPEILSSGVEEVRGRAGGGSGGLVVLCLALGIFKNKFRMGSLFPSLLPRSVVLIVCLASFVLSYSRIESVVLLLLVLSLLGWFSQVRLSTIAGLTAIFVAILAMIFTTPDEETDTFRSKLARSVTEITVVNFQDEQSINDNWRAFETSRVVDSFSSSTTLEQVFGQGFGTLVDMGLEMNLGGEYFREIPIFHNGYAYILIKTGLLGLLCYVFFYIYVIRFAVRYCNSSNAEQRGFARLLLGCVLSLMLMMYVVGGMAEVAGSVFVLLLGYLVRRIMLLQIEIVRSGTAKRN